MKLILQPFNNDNNNINNNLLNLFSSHSIKIIIIHYLLLQPFGSKNFVKTVPPLHSMTVTVLGVFFKLQTYIRKA
jgi:hypothetical protein